jgi:hypothetical protein
MYASGDKVFVTSHMTVIKSKGFFRIGQGKLSIIRSFSNRPQTANRPAIKDSFQGFSPPTAASLHEALSNQQRINNN